MVAYAVIFVGVCGADGQYGEGDSRDVLVALTCTRSPLEVLLC